MLSILFSISRITMLNDAFKKHFQIVLIDHKWPHNNDAKALDKSEVNSQCNWILSTNVAYIVYCHLFGNSIHCTDTSSATMPCVSGLTPAKTFKLVLVVSVFLDSLASLDYKLSVGKWVSKLYFFRFSVNTVIQVIQ